MARIPETGEMLLRQEPEASIKLVPGIETMRRGQPTALLQPEAGAFFAVLADGQDNSPGRCVDGGGIRPGGGFILQVRD